MLTLKTAWADGTRQLVFEPLERLEKLAALTPRPRINLVLYHIDVLACPRCGGRMRLIATVEDPDAMRAILADRAPPFAASRAPSHATAHMRFGLAPAEAER